MGNALDSMPLATSQNTQSAESTVLLYGSPVAQHKNKRPALGQAVEMFGCGGLLPDLEVHPNQITIFFHMHSGLVSFVRTQG